MPSQCCLAVHHFMRDAVSLKSGRQIKAGKHEDCGLSHAELRTRYAKELQTVLLDEEAPSCDGRAMCNFAALKL